MRQFSINKDEQPVLRELQSQTKLIKKIEFYFRYFFLISVISIIGYLLIVLNVLI